MCHPCVEIDKQIEQDRELLEEPAFAELFIAHLLAATVVSRRT